MRVGVLLILLLLSYGLRAYNMGGPSLWYDEGVSWTFARLAWPRLLSTIAHHDLNPPLYPVLLHLWIDGAGASAYALRMLSLVAGVLIVALVMILARRVLKQWWLGALAGVFAASSIFMIDYSQEARAYTLAALWTTLATYALVRALDERVDERRWWTCYTLAGALALYSHYATVLLFPAHLLAVLVARPRRLWALALSWVTIAALYAPWLPSMVVQVQVVRSAPNFFWKGSISPFLAPGRVLAATFSRPGAFTGDDRQLVALTACGLVVAVLVSVHRRVWRGTILLVITVALSLLEAGVITAHNPIFLDRYLLPLAPLMAVLVASFAGVTANQTAATVSGFLRRSGAVLLTVAVIGAAAGATIRTWGHAPLGAHEIKDGDMRAAVAYIRRDARPGDAILLDQDTSPVFSYYYTGFLGPEGVGWFPALHELERPDDFSQLAATLNAAAQGHSRLWVIWWHPQYADATHFVRNMLEEKGQLRQSYAGAQGLLVQLYHLARGVSFSAHPEDQQPERIAFGDALEFDSYHIEQQAIAGGGAFAVDTWFSLLRPSTASLVGVLQLTRDGTVWAQAAPPLASYNYGTEHWVVGRAVSGRLILPINGATPPGMYRLQLGVYNIQTKQDLTAVKSDGVTLPPMVALGEVTVVPPRQPVTVPPPALQLNTQVGGHLILWGEDRLPARLEQGANQPVDLLWRSTSQPNVNFLAQLRLVADHASVAFPIGTPSELTPGYATSLWPAGSVFRQVLALAVPASFPIGEATVQLVITTDQRAQQVVITLGRMEIQSRPRQFQPPADLGQPFREVFSGAAVLAGATINTDAAVPGGHVVVRLVWECQASLPGDYTVFVHLLDARNLIGGRQHDGPPNDGRDPTSSWEVGQWIIDEHIVPLPRSTLPGIYRVEVGLYRLRGTQFDRLLLPDGTSSAIVGTVTVR
ncbi:MAG: glycosyltransferase family 39 protein [Chloroflexi bacterium]|nr:glycosyltransferase family 39 protein [Chloroflexota bacterium]